MRLPRLSMALVALAAGGCGEEAATDPAPRVDRGASGEESEGGDVSQQIQQQIDGLKQRLAANPQDAAALAELARLQYQSASLGENYDEATGTFDDKAREQLRQAERAWDRCLATDPARADAKVAAVMAQALGPGGLNELDKAVGALQIVAEEPATASVYAQLAALAYQAGDDRTGDLARAEALELADSEAERDQMRQVLDDIQALETQPDP